MWPPSSQLTSFPQPLPLANCSWSQPWPVGMLELIGGVHAQPDRTQGRAIQVALKDWVAMLIKGNRANAAMTSGTLVHVPGIKGGIGGDLGGGGHRRDPVRPWPRGV